MRVSSNRFPSVWPLARIAPGLIAAGLAILLATAWWPVVPVVTGMALVALGATAAMIERVERAAVWRAAMAVHLVTYVSLYLLFVGAVLHAAMTGPQRGVSSLLAVDLGVSAVVVMLVARLSFTAMAGDSPTR